MDDARDAVVQSMRQCGRDRHAADIVAAHRANRWMKQDISACQLAIRIALQADGWAVGVDDGLMNGGAANAGDWIRFGRRVRRGCT